MADAYETVIGLEVHVELSTKTKIFCGCGTTFGMAPNTQVCPVCLGLPGVLPVMNETALEDALLVGLALGCTIAPRFKFDRKHYYYPDLPKNYQISQYDLPFAEHGKAELPNGVTVGITRVHLEEDAGKLIHEGTGGQIGTGSAALVDYNRAGMPLLEIVSEPDLRNPADAVEYMKSLQTLVRYLNVSDGNLEEGSLRCDANISVRKQGAKEFGAKVEIKNMNSFRAVGDALIYEAARQREALDKGEKIGQETRLWNEDAGETKSMRGKEGSADYRYFPEPDLLPFTVTQDRLAKLRARLPELPRAKKLRYVADLGLSEYDAGVLTADRSVATFFEAILNLEGSAINVDPLYKVPAKTAANWITTELLGALNSRKLEISRSPISPTHLGKLIALIDDKTISGKIAKTVFAGMIETGKDPATIVKEQGLVQITDTGAIDAAVRDVIAKNPGPVADFKAGKQQAAGFLVGQVMKATQGKANPQAVQKALKEALGG